MCLLVYKQPSVDLPISNAVRAGTTNSDGFGLAYHDGARWQLHHTLDLLDHCRVLPSITPYPALVHYRMATHGVVNLDNCHPFLVGEPDSPHAFVVAHNGMFQDLPREQARSDTRIMVEHVFGWLRPGWHLDAVMRGQLGKILGWNKVAVLFPDGTRVLFGEAQGVWEPSNDGSLKEGIWYSNTGYRSYTSYTKPATTVTPLLPAGGAARYTIGNPQLSDKTVLGFALYTKTMVDHMFCVNCYDEDRALGYYDEVTVGDVGFAPYTLGQKACQECGKTLNDIKHAKTAAFQRQHGAVVTTEEDWYGH